MVYSYSQLFTVVGLSGIFLSLNVNNCIYLCRKVFTFREIQISVIAYLLSALFYVLEDLLLLYSVKTNSSNSV